ncbi:hypothetical protein ACJZ2D_002145 [Fusarium nematophilum]
MDGLLYGRSAPPAECKEVIINPSAGRNSVLLSVTSRTCLQAVCPNRAPSTRKRQKPIMATQVPEMRHHTVSRPGNILDGLKLGTVARPSESVGKKEVLVEVVAAGINPADYKMTEMRLVSRAMVSYPKTPSMDFSGRAVAVRSDIPDIKAGDNVISRINPIQSGSPLSEYVVVVDNVGNSPPDLFAATDDYLLPIGHVKFVGGHMNFDSAKSLVPKAFLLSFLGGSKHKFEVFFTKNSHEDLAQIARWMGEGQVKTVIDSVFGFDEVPQAYKKLKEGSSTGKIVIHVKKE